MGSMRGRLRRIEQQGERQMLSFQLEDGSRVRFPPSTFLECLSHEWKHRRELRSGKEVTRDAHPLLEALKRAKDRERLTVEGYGIILMTDAENDRSVRGEQE